MTLVLDTGVLLASIDRGDRAHEACVGLLESTEGALVVPSPVLVELGYWVERRAGVGAWVAVCDRIAGGAFDLFPIDADMSWRAAQLQQHYAGLRLGFVDACVFVTCETLGEGKVATLDRRDFSVLRTDSGAALEILPA